MVIGGLIYHKVGGKVLYLKCISKQGKMEQPCET